MENNQIIERLSRIEQLLIGTKKFLTTDELSAYINVSKSSVYKLIRERSVPFCRPNGKHIYFEKEKIDEWILRKSHMSTYEMQQSAHSYAKKRK